MALSGSFSTTGYSGGGSPDNLTFAWTATQDITTNQSTVSWTVKVGGGNSGWRNTLFSRKVTVGSETKGYGYPYDGNYPQESVYNGTLVFQGQTVISHNADGTGSFTASVWGNIEYSYPAIGYYNTTGSQTFTLDTIARAASITSAPNFSDQDSPVLQYSNPAGTAATVQAAISLDGSAASVAYRTISNTGTSYTFNLTTAERNTLRNATTSASRTVYFLLKTTIGSNTFTKSLARTFTVANVPDNRPTVSNSATPNNAAIPSTYRSRFDGTFVQNFSKAVVTVTASAKYSATISGYSTSLSNKSYTGASFTSDTITGSGTLPLVSTATDSRGYSNSATTNLTVYAYTTPTLTGVSLFRCNSSGTAQDSGTNIKIVATRGYASVNSINRAILRYRFRESTSSSWGSWITLIDRTSTSTNTYNNVISGTFGVTKAYSFQLSVLDDLGNEVIQNLDVPTEVVTLHMKEGGLGVGVGTYAVNDNEFRLAWKTRSDNSIWVGTTYDDTGGKNIGVETSGSGRMYMYAANANNGTRGLYFTAHGTGSGKYGVQCDSNNNITYNGTLSGNASSATNATNVYAKSGSYKSMANALLEMVYPVGSVYISTSSTSPATFLGGTWARINGRFLLGLGSNTANTVTTYGSLAAGSINRTTAKEQGGEVLHKLTTTEMPKHKHNLIVRVGASTGSYYGYPPASNSGGSNSEQNVGYETGGDGSHNNMPPYIAVYMWERTA